MTTLPTTPTCEEGRKWFWSGDCLMENQPDNFCSDHVLHSRKDGSLYVREGAREQIIEAVNLHSTLTKENARLAERVRVLEGDVQGREDRRQEILDWLQEEIGTAWQCGNCGYSTYHSASNECAECGTAFPTLHLLAFKLHASHFDYDAARTALKEDGK